MAGRKRQGSFRGDMNAILNGLVREGVIAAFETSFEQLNATKLPVRITVVAPSANSPEAVKHAVITALNRFGDEVSVMVKAG